MTTNINDLPWKKSSLSGNEGQCVSVAIADDGNVFVRDDKNEDGTVLSFSPDEWSAFVGGVKRGEFDF